MAETGRDDYQKIVAALAALGYRQLTWIFGSPEMGEPWVRTVYRLLPGSARAERMQRSCVSMRQPWALEVQFRMSAQSEVYALREEVLGEVERVVDALYALENVGDEISWSYGPGDQDGFTKVRMEFTTHYDRAVGVTA